MNDTNTSHNPWYTLGAGLLCIVVIIIPFMAETLVHELTPSRYLDMRMQPDYWYFIYDNFFRGIGTSIGIVVSLALIAFCWRRCPDEARMLLWMTFLWHGYAVLRSISIYFHCPNLFDPNKHQTSWQSFDAYLHSPFNNALFWVNMAFALALAFSMKKPAPKSNFWKTMPKSPL